MRAVFEGASNAAYADDVDLRRSSQGQLYRMFGGLIHWRATLQRTVTRSTTESELLAASEAIAELIWWFRVFEAIDFNPKERPLILCDNQQTIRILTKTNSKLVTKLKHVDIHQSWMRQAVEERNIKIRYCPIANMPADGLTKILSVKKHEIFVKQLGLVDIRERLKMGKKSRQSKADREDISQHEAANTKVQTRKRKNAERED